MAARTQNNLCEKIENKDKSRDKATEANLQASDYRCFSLVLCTNHSLSISEAEMEILEK